MKATPVISIKIVKLTIVLSDKVIILIVKLYFLYLDLNKTCGVKTYVLHHFWY